MCYKLRDVLGTNHIKAHTHKSKEELNDLRTVWSFSKLFLTNIILTVFSPRLLTHLYSSAEVWLVVVHTTFNKAPDWFHFNYDSNWLYNYMNQCPYTKAYKTTLFSQMNDCSFRFHLLYYSPIFSWLITCSWPYSACWAHSYFSLPTALLWHPIHNSLAVSWHFFISRCFYFHKLCMCPSALVAFTYPQKCWIRIPAQLPARDVIYSFFSYTNRV